MCDHEPGLLTSSMPATVILRNTSRDIRRPNAGLFPFASAGCISGVTIAADETALSCISISDLEFTDYLAVVLNQIPRARAAWRWSHNAATRHRSLYSCSARSQLPDRTAPARCRANRGGFPRAIAGDTLRAKLITPRPFRADCCRLRRYSSANDAL